MYADDTVLYYSGNSQNDIVKKLNADLNNISCWLKCNKLSLNSKKSEFIMIGSRQKLKHLDNNNLNIHIDGNCLKRVHKCKHLGVIIDEQLNWHDHIEHVSNKVSRSVYMLKKAKPFIPNFALNIMYNSIVATQ